MKRIILRQAFEELNDAIAYYEEQQAGLGLRMNSSGMSVGFWKIPLFPGFAGAVTVVSISEHFRTMLPTLSVKILYGFLPLHMATANLSIGLGEKTKIRAS